MSEMKPPIPTKSERRAASGGKTDAPRKYSKDGEEAYRSNEFWDNCSFAKKNKSNISLL